MQILSINVAMPETIQFRGKSIRTGFFKRPVEGAIAVNEVNIAGDGQADLRHHGGRDKAIYAYPHEHYPFWRTKLSYTEAMPRNGRISCIIKKNH